MSTEIGRLLGVVPSKDIKEVENAIQAYPFSLRRLLEGIVFGGAQVVNVRLVWGVEKFDVFGFRIQQIEPAIGELKNLKVLDSGDNYLSSLPATIGELKNLTRLHLRGNKSSSLPPEIAGLKNLTELELRGNPISMEEQEKIRQLLSERCWILF